MNELEKAAFRAIQAWEQGTPVEEFEGYMDALKDAQNGPSRLHIAAMALQGLLAHRVDDTPFGFARAALELADALIESADE